MSPARKRGAAPTPPAGKPPLPPWVIASPRAPRAPARESPGPSPDGAAAAAAVAAAAAAAAAAPDGSDKGKRAPAPRSAKEDDGAFLVRVLLAHDGDARAALCACGSSADAERLRGVLARQAAVYGALEHNGGEEDEGEGGGGGGGGGGGNGGGGDKGGGGGAGGGAGGRLAAAARRAASAVSAAAANAGRRLTGGGGGGSGGGSGSGRGGGGGEARPTLEATGAKRGRPVVTVDGDDEDEQGRRAGPSAANKQRRLGATPPPLPPASAAAAPKAAAAAAAAAAARASSMPPPRPRRAAPPPPPPTASAASALTANPAPVPALDNNNNTNGDTPFGALAARAAPAGNFVGAKGRRLLRATLSGLQSEVAARRDALRDPRNASQLIAALSDAAALHAHARARARESCADAALLAALAACGSEMALRQGGEAHGRRPSDLVAVLRQAWPASAAVRGGGGGGARAAGGSAGGGRGGGGGAGGGGPSIDWAGVGRAAAGQGVASAQACFSGGTMLGPLASAPGDLAAKLAAKALAEEQRRRRDERRGVGVGAAGAKLSLAARRRAEDEAAPLVRPAQADAAGDADGERQETDVLAADMYARLLEACGRAAEERGGAGSGGGGSDGAAGARAGDDGDGGEDGDEPPLLPPALRRKWRALGRVPLSDAVCAESFANTVENVFTLSFLVRDRRVAVEPPGEGGAGAGARRHGLMLRPRTTREWLLSDASSYSATAAAAAAAAGGGAAASAEEEEEDGQGGGDDAADGPGNGRAAAAARRLPAAPVQRQRQQQHQLVLRLSAEEHAVMREIVPPDARLMPARD